MEYVFGETKNAKTLRTKGNQHTDLTGFCQITQLYQDEKITDSFRVIRKIESKEDDFGNCYDWYIIDSHYRIIDKTDSIIEAQAKNAANIDYLSMMTGIELLNSN